MTDRRSRGAMSPALTFTLLGLFVMIAGLGVSYVAGRVTTLECKRWKEVRCTMTRSWLGIPTSSREIDDVSKAFVDEHRSRRVGDQTTYAAALSFRGASIPLTHFSSDRRGARANADVINDFLRTGRPSLHHRIVPWVGLGVGAILFGAGGFMLVWIHGSKLRRAWSSGGRSTGEPSRRIRSSFSGPMAPGDRSSAVWGLLFGGVVLSFVSALILHEALPAISAGHWLAALLLVVPLLALITLFEAVRKALRGFLNRGAEFAFDTGRVLPGGNLRGAIYSKRLQPGTKDVSLYLQCIQRRTVTSGSKKRVREGRIWSDQRAVPAAEVTFSPEGARIPVSFELPDSALPSGEDGLERVRWFLSARSSIGGIGFAADFEVPVGRS